MDSTTAAERSTQLKEEAIRRQIALLQAQLPSNAKKASAATGKPTPVSPKRKRAPGVLAPATPSPKKRKVERKSTGSALPSLSARLSNVKSAPPPKKPEPQYTQPLPSKLVNKLASLDQPSSAFAGPSRSSAFTQPAQGPEVDEAFSRRNDDLTLAEDLPSGPQEHKAPADDPHFERLEPYSGIAMKSRSTSHADFQEYMYGRTFISPSALYSIIRLQPNKQAYDVPVDGDFVLIAVVAERGPIRMSKAPVGIEREAEDEGACSDDEHIPITSLSKDTKPWDKGKRGKGKKTAVQDGPAPRKSRKYVNLKLIDFGARSASSATGGKAVLRGDAFLSLLLFESEKVDDIVDEDTGKKKRVYRGGSRGAFETMSTLREGSVIALLNPRVLRPFQRASDTPHPTANVLGLTPESAESTLVLGYAQDLGLCAVVRKDGKTCGAWTDKRVSDVCEYHVTHAVQHLRAGRAEFSQGTSGMTSAASQAKKKFGGGGSNSAYDPSRKWGLAPADGTLREREENGGGATYVVQGHVLSKFSKPAVVSDIGREGQAKAARVIAKRNEEKLLKRLSGKSESAKVVMRARETAASKRESSSGKGKAKATSVPEEEDNDDDSVVGGGFYGASMVKDLGFDPTTFGSGGRPERRVMAEDVRKKLDGLAAAVAGRSSDTIVRGARKKSNVRAPPPKASEDTGLSFLASSDEEEDEEDAAISRRTVSKRDAPAGAGGDFVDLDGSSDVELET